MTNLHSGAIVVDSTNRFLYVQLDRGRAVRFGVAVGREEFGWSGQAKIMRKVMWPTLTLPELDDRARQFAGKVY